LPLTFSNALEYSALPIQYRIFQEMQELSGNKFGGLKGKPGLIGVPGHIYAQN